MTRTVKKPIKTVASEPLIEKPKSVPRYKVVVPVLGYEAGTILEGNDYLFRFQLKHKSIVKVE